MDVHRRQDLPRRRQESVHHHRIVLRRRIAVQVGQLIIGAHRLGDIFDDLLDPPEHELPNLQVLIPDRPVQHDRVGNDVLRALPADDRAEADHAGRKRADLPADDMLDRRHHQTGHDDGVDAAVRLGAMAALADDGDVHLIVGRRTVAVFDDHIAVFAGERVDLPVHVQRQNGVDLRVFQYAVLDHRQRPARPLFRRLEQKLHLPVQLRLMPFQQFGDAQQDRRVGVMAASVHVVVLRPVFELRLLVDAQSVHVRPQRDRFSGIRTEQGHDSRVPLKRRIGDPHFLQTRLHERRSLRQAQADFRNLVQLPPPGDDLAADLPGFFQNCHCLHSISMSFFIPH